MPKARTTAELHKAADKYKSKILYTQKDGMFKASALIAELSAKLREGEWQDISTAPKDGTSLILHEKHPMTGESNVYEGYYYKTVDEGRGTEDAWYDAEHNWVSPTEFMPLPTPPKKES